MAEPPGRQEGNVALAFGMVCAAGACTSLGAAMAFCVNLEVSCLPRARHAGCPCSSVPLALVVPPSRSAQSFRPPRPVEGRAWRSVVLGVAQWEGAGRG